VRNLVVAGNPLFPLDVSLLGIRLFPGAYTRAAMLESSFHAPDLAAALVVSAHLIGFWLVPAALSGAALGVALAWRRPEWRAWAWLGPAAFVWHYLVVPYSSQARFLLWATALLFLPLAALPRRRRWFAAVGALAGGGAALMTVGGIPLDIGALHVSRYGHLNLGQWPSIAAVAALIPLGLFILRRRTRWGGVGRLASAFALGAAAATAMATTTTGFVRTDLVGLKELPLAAYEVVWKAAPRAVAYVGRNRPYYLAGRDGLIRVTYVNVDGCGGCLLSDYACELARQGLLDRSREKDDWRRRAPDYARWLAALKAEGVQMLFVERLSDSEATYIAHDADGFPLERAWAREHPDDFEPAAVGASVEVFGVRPFVPEAI
jgi:hypothetical protein